MWQEKPSMFSVSPISIVPLHQHNSLSNLANLFRRAKSQKLPKTGVSLFASVGHSHPTTNKDVEPSEAAGGFVFYCDKANIVSVNICVVHGWHSNSDFKPNVQKCKLSSVLSREICRAIKRLKVLHSISCNLSILAITIAQPDLRGIRLHQT